MSEILSALFITDNYKDQLRRKYDATIIRPNRELEIEVGNVIVTQTFNIPDLLDPNFGIRHESRWLLTYSEFASKFNVIDDDHRTEEFALITKK